ncbi:HAD-IIIC family phosphatase [Succinimonas sp.]|uniref:HAD-IIIC family phosphatase n=1 Tax=Succinimonas sp. TaxID=1936151 RepID=UPI003870DBBE
MLFREYKKAVHEIKIDDFSALLNIGRKWKKIQDNEATIIKIAIVGSASIQLVTSVFRALLTRYDIYADIYEGEYNGIFMDVFDEKSKLYTFSPEYIVILPDYRDVEVFCPEMLSEESEVQSAVDNAYDQYARMFDIIHKNIPQTQLLIANFVSPIFEALGNLSSNYIFSKRSFYRQLNYTLTKRHPPFVFVLDVDALSEYIGKRDFVDECSYFLNKSSFNLQYIGFYCDLIARQFEAFSGKPKKCLVLDLDNTLWGGVVGDLGYDGILLDPNDAEGEAFLAFQRYVLELKKRGVILCICSKNDEDIAKEPFEKNENMILKLSDISSFFANWNDKATNIKKISNELNIGTDSMVFFDDNPTERELIREFLPEVRVIDVPEDPALYTRALDQAHAFEWTQLTNEDLGRTETYANNKERNALMASCVDYDDYLINLKMVIECKQLTETDIERFVQLTNKSNQFNLRTKRYSEAEIIALLDDQRYALLSVKLEDRFCKYGIIGCIILHFTGDTCFIENWVMSCRVLKKRVENYTIERIVDIARNHGCSAVLGEYRQTNKNEMVRNLYEFLNFDLITDALDCKQYILPLERIAEYKQNYYFREIIHEGNY